MLKKIIIDNPVPGITKIAYYRGEDYVQMDIHSRDIITGDHFYGIEGAELWKQLLEQEPKAYVPMVKQLAEEAAGIRNLNFRNHSVPFFMARALAWGFLVHQRGWSISDARNTYGSHSITGVTNAVQRSVAADKFLTPEERMIRYKFNELLKENLL